MADSRKRPVIGKLVTPGLRSGFLEVGTSPTTPFEFKVLSPRGMINSDMGGVGLGIVAALEKSGENFPAKGSNPVVISEVGGDLEEEYTIVTHHRENKLFTKVFHGGFVTKKGAEIRRKDSIFNITVAGFGDDAKVSGASDFLSSCVLCDKRLNGRDIFMYRGEKAFCSPECRSRQIGMDERRDKYCSSEASDGASRQMFTTGIFAI